MRYLIAFLALVTFSYPASARHHQRHVHFRHEVVSNQITCNRFGCSDWSSQPAQQRQSSRQFSVKTHGYKRPLGRVQSVGGYQGNLIAAARAYNGMTAGQIGLRRHSLWCMAFLHHIGLPGHDDRAISALRLPHVAPSVGSIAVYRHHVGIVTGFYGRYPIIISGNSNGRRVYEGVYPRTPIAYVTPG